MQKNDSYNIRNDRVVLSPAPNGVGRNRVYRYSSVVLVSITTPIKYTFANNLFYYYMPLYGKEVVVIKYIKKMYRKNRKTVQDILYTTY